MKRNPTTLPIGSVIHGTLVSSDILLAVLQVAETIRMTREDRNCVMAVERSVAHFDSTSERIDYEGIEDDIERLGDVLNGYVPEFCYFGAHGGDASDFGVWPNSEAIEDGERDGKIQRMAELPDIVMIEDPDGELTLYRCEHRVIFSTLTD